MLGEEPEQNVLLSRVRFKVGEKDILEENGLSSGTTPQAAEVTWLWPKKKV